MHGCNGRCYIFRCCFEILPNISQDPLTKAGQTNKKSTCSIFVKLHSSRLCSGQVLPPSFGACCHIARQGFCLTPLSHLWLQCELLCWEVPVVGELLWCQLWALEPFVAAVQVQVPKNHKKIYIYRFPKRPTNQGHGNKMRWAGSVASCPRE